MHKSLTIFIFLFIILEAHTQIHIVPLPNEIVISEKQLNLNSELNVYAEKNTLDRTYLTQELSRLGIKPRFIEKEKKAELIFKLNIEKEGINEGYCLDVNRDRSSIIITADTKNGLIYGLQSLIQLGTKKNNQIVFKECRINDAPAFRWRAYMLDESRHFQGIKTVKNLLNEMAKLKMNVFHWHLVDDPGWRIEIKKYPKLTEIGSKRDFSNREISPIVWDSLHSEKSFYTQEEIKEIVEYASVRGISIIPEIEIPAHASASIAAYNWLGTKSKKEKVGVWGDLYEVTDPKVETFLKDVLDEVAMLFPSKIIHIGGDEANYSFWENSPEVNTFMNNHSIPSYADLQLWIINKMSAYLSSNGIRMIGWNEITGDNIRNEEKMTASQSEKLSPETIVQFWDGEIGLLNKSINQGYDVVNSNRLYTYLDYTYENIPIEKAYSFNPITEGLSKKEASKVLGLGCQMWGEYTPTAKRVYFQTFPRIAAYAECGWTNNEKKDYKSFCNRMKYIEADWRKKNYLQNQPVYHIPEPVDIWADTWVANDALGRRMPDIDSVGPIKNDQRRTVGIFYITWHTQGLANMKSPYEANVTNILNKDPEARLDANNHLWTEGSYHWGEPEMGYFLSQDEWVIRKDMSMLADAGVDVLIMDVTNAVRYWEEWEVTFSTMEKMKAEGNKVPQFCFWAFNGPVITVVQDLYERIYANKKYTDLWFHWDGKPLLLYNGRPKFDANGQDTPNPNLHYEADAVSNKDNPHYGNPFYTEQYYNDYSDDVKRFFTLRTMWWGYYEWAGQRFIGTEDNWSFGYSMADERIKKMNPEELLSIHQGKREQAAVTPAQHPVTMTKENMGVGKSWSRETGEPKLNKYDLPEPTYVPWLGKTVENPEGYGIYFQERWEDALNANPEFLYINDWNEWTAGKYQPDNGGTTPWLGRDNSFFFVDQYNAEFNRGIQPSKGLYSDNYYMQMAQNIRRYKGVRPIPQNIGFSNIKVDGDFSDWDRVNVTYHDTRNDIIHRDAKGYGGTHYINISGRNDIIASKIALDKKNIYFYSETTSDITAHTDSNWMMLLIDSDKDPTTGWFGYDFIINKNVVNDSHTVLMGYNAKSKTWSNISPIEYTVSGNKIEISVPRKLLDMENDSLIFDFKWTDNPVDLKDPISLCTDGDTAPNRRFNYRCIWKRK